MHEIDNLIFRTKRGLLNRTYSRGLYHQNPPMSSVPHNYAMSPYTLHATIPQTSTHFIDSPPEPSNSNSSENVHHLNYLQIKIQLLTIKYQTLFSNLKTMFLKT